MKRRQIYDIFLSCPETRLCHFMQIVSVGDILHELSKPVFSGIKRENITQYRLLKILPIVQNVEV